jgi:hypothetical protein
VTPTGKTNPPEAEFEAMMTFKVPTVDLTDPGSQFLFEHDGVEHSIPLMQHIPMTVLEAADKRGGVGHIPVLEELGLQDAADAWRTMTPYQIRLVTTAWTEASAASLGESKASSS